MCVNFDFLAPNPRKDMKLFVSVPKTRKKTWNLFLNSAHKYDGKKKQQNRFCLPNKLLDHSIKQGSKWHLKIETYVSFITFHKVSNCTTLILFVL